MRALLLALAVCCSNSGSVAASDFWKPVEGHQWKTEKQNWGYGGLPQSLDELHERYAESLRLLNELKENGLSAGVYTQTTDVEGEVNGLITYDRKVIKFPAAKLKELHEILGL